MQNHNNGVEYFDSPKVTTKKPVPALRIEGFTNDTKPVHFNDGQNMDEWQPAPIAADTTATELLTDKVFIPNWHNKPVELPAVLTLGGLSILTHQNLTSIIAAPGFGKSSICESILASYLNPDADCLGFKVWFGCMGVIYIDFERTNSDVWNSFYRMCRRAGITDGQDVKGVQIAGMRSIPRLAERLEALEFLLQNNPCSLLLLDGAGNLVTDTNDLPQAIECTIRLRELTVKYNVSILTTLHPNPGTCKPRGHTGGELMRESECGLLLKKGENDCRIITSEFEYGKNRNNAPVTSGYKWSDESMMFVSADVEDFASGTKEGRKQFQLTRLKADAQQLLPPPITLRNKELAEAIMQREGAAVATANRQITKMVKENIINKRADGYYQLTL